MKEPRPLHKAGETRRIYKPDGSSTEIIQFDRLGKGEDLPDPGAPEEAGEEAPSGEEDGE